MEDEAATTAATNVELNGEQNGVAEEGNLTPMQFMQKQMETLMSMQLKMTQGTISNTTPQENNTLADDWRRVEGSSTRKLVRQVKVPEGRHDMSLAEFRTYSKDCKDYAFLTQYSDQQVVLQMRLHMDVDLKRAIDTNYCDVWDSYTVEDAIKAVGSIVNEISNPAVYRKEFDNMEQPGDEPIREFVVRLKTCAIDCNFVCPYEETHDLTLPCFAKRAYVTSRHFAKRAYVHHRFCQRGVSENLAKNRFFTYKHYFP